MNILDVQNKLKNFSEEQLVQEMQAPTGNAPQFLVLSEIQRRKRMRDDLQQQQAQPVKTVAEEAIAAGGVPQGGIGQLAGAMGQGSSNAQMPQQQAPEQQPQGMYGGGIVKLAPGGAVGGRMTLRDAGDGKVIITDENGNPITGPLPAYYAQTLIDTSKPPAPTQTGVFNPDTGMEDILARARAFQEENFSDLPNYGPPGSKRQDDRSWAERLGYGVLKDTPIAKTFAEFGNFPLIFDLEPKATAEINRLADVRRDVPLAALEERMKKARMNITGPSVFDNPADVADLTAPKVRSDNSFNPDKGMEDILARARAFQEENFSDLPNYGPPGSEGQGGGSLARMVREALRLHPIPTEPRDPSGEPPKQTTTTTKPDGGVKKPDSNADDPRSPGGFGAMSPYESELMNMLKNKEKQAEHDKWMSLAKAGLAMMSSKSPNFGVAFGEGAAAGLEDYQAQKSQYETDRLALLGGVEKSRLGREAAARAGQGKPDRLSMNSIYTGLQKQLEAQFRILSDSMYEDEKAAAMAEIKNLRARMSQIESTVGLVDLDTTKIS
jgi:cold shock CspA family protein